MPSWNQTPDNRCMAFSEWPQHDRVAWLAALEPAGFLKSGGAAAGWSEGGRGMVVDSYGRWLTWLARTEQLDRSSRPEDRITRERVAAYAEALLVGNAPMTVQGRIGQLGRAMRALAPDADWSWLSRAADRMRAEAAPVREKRSRMQEVHALADLGIGLMRRAQASDEHFAIQRAALYRDGLIIALMAHRPLRIRTFAAITLGQHLTQRDKEWWLAFAAADTKNMQAMELPFPDALVPHLELYLDQHRPVLLRGKPVPGQVRPPTAALWIAKGGRMMSSDAINVQVTAHTRTAFGQPVNPHLFRDCAATSIAIQDPEHVRMIVPILGHSTIATSERHYNQACTLEASRRYQQAIGQTRRKAGGQQS